MNGRFCVLALVVACGGNPNEWATSIGIEGGVLEARGVVLTIPAGALAEPTEIRIRRLDETPLGWRALSDVFQFEPAGLTFADPVEVRFDTDGSDPAEVVAWITEATERLSAMRAGAIVTTSIDHFSIGFVGVEDVGVDGGPDVGVDAPLDAPTDAGVDADDTGTDAPDDANVDASPGSLDCWVEEIMDPTPAGPVATRLDVTASDLVVVGDELKQIRHAQLYSWDGSTWTRSDLAADLALGIAADEFRAAALTVDSDGDLHAVLHAERLEKPNPFYLHQDGTSWSVEDVWPTAPTMVGSGVCYSAENAKSNIEVGADGTIHAVFDCAPPGEARLYRNAIYCRHDGSWACRTAAAGTIGLEYGRMNPELALIGDIPHLLFHHRQGTDFRLHRFGALDSDGFTEGPSVEDYGAGCAPIDEPYIWAADRGTLLNIDGTPVAYYTYADWCRFPNVLELRRAELVDDAFVVRPIASSVTIVSNALVLSDGTEIIAVRGHGPMEGGAPPIFPPTDLHLLRIDAEDVTTTEVTWPSLPDELGGSSQPDRIAVVTLAEADGIVHGTYLGTDGVLHHVRTCP